MSNNSNNVVKKEPSADVPIFLRKTYHMIDTCDPAIACWDEPDGTTFVVKDPVKFEQTIIPQFFKHSKFSSFVRQLNFYSFRKIKLDTIRIDPKLEAETANYWRFRHEKFQRGKPEWLIDIKRMNSASSTSTAAASNKKGGASNKKASSTENNAEVQSLKKRIEEMSKNINELTAMVQKVSLKQEEHDIVGNKRLKAFDDQDDDADAAMCLPDPALSSSSSSSSSYSAVARPDEMLSSDAAASVATAMELDDNINSSNNNNNNNNSLLFQVSDNEFVDELFTAFKDEDALLGMSDDDDVGLDYDNSLLEPATQQQQPQQQQQHQQPDPELMRRLGDALRLLPKEIQEMIVDRLVAAITSTDSFLEAASSTSQKTLFSNKLVADMPAKVPHTSADDDDDDSKKANDDDKKEPALPLAAATLAALLHHYSTSQQDDDGKNSKNVQQKNNLPVAIPVHA